MSQEVLIAMLVDAQPTTTFSLACSCRHFYFSLRDLPLNLVPALPEFSFGRTCSREQNAQASFRIQTLKYILATGRYRVQALALKDADETCTSDLAQCGSLRTLHMFRARHLVDLSAVGRNTSLETLRLTYLHRMDLATLRPCEGLRTLELIGRIFTIFHLSWHEQSPSLP